MSVTSVKQEMEAHVSKCNIAALIASSVSDTQRGRQLMSKPIVGAEPAAFMLGSARSQ